MWNPDGYNHTWQLWAHHHLWSIDGAFSCLSGFGFINVLCLRYSIDSTPWAIILMRSIAVVFCTFSCTVFTTCWCVYIFNLHKWLVFHILFCFLLFPTNTPFLKRIHPAFTFSALLWIIAQHVHRWSPSTCPTGNSADGQESLSLYQHNSKATSKYKYPRRFSCLGQGKTFSGIHTSLWNICVMVHTNPSSTPAMPGYSQKHLLGG